MHVPKQDFGNEGYVIVARANIRYDDGNILAVRASHSQRPNVPRAVLVFSAGIHSLSARPLMRIFSVFLLAIFTVVGCKDAAKSPMREAGVRIGGQNEQAFEKRKVEGGERKDARAPEPGGFVAHEQPEDGKAGGGEKKPKIEQPRRIKYSAEMRLIVEQFSTVEDAIKVAVKDAKGFVAQAEVNNSPGTPRLGHWRIRVPIEHFDAFRDAVKKLGEIERNTVDSEDITAQYYDLEAHIKNRQAERETVRELLKEIGKKDLKTFFEVKRELDSITDDINRKEGQLRLWANLTDLTTVNVHIREKQKFIGDEKPKETEIPTFNSRATKAWNDSWDSVTALAENIAVLAILLTPWLPVPIILAFFLWLAIRLLVGPIKAAKPKAKSPPKQAEEPEPPTEVQ